MLSFPNTGNTISCAIGFTGLEVLGGVCAICSPDTGIIFKTKKMEQNTTKMATKTNNKEHYRLNLRNFSIYTGIVFLFGTITGMVIAHMLYCGTL